MRLSGWQSRFWQRYRPGGGGAHAGGGAHPAGGGGASSSGSSGGGASSSGSSSGSGSGPKRPLFEELKDGTAYLLKAMAAIYLVREYLVEFMVVRASVGAEICGLAAVGWHFVIARWGGSKPCCGCGLAC